jgi:hypothetical protein
MRNSSAAGAGKLNDATISVLAASSGMDIQALARFMVVPLGFASPGQSFSSDRKVSASARYHCQVRRRSLAAIGAINVARAAAHVRSCPRALYPARVMAPYSFYDRRREAASGG